ncbi:MAG: sulfate adenylyltransferase subunit CysN [Deltaproteobacteria bacterium]|nr:sulfate adenylyltransferase subunit CysN [Deltaproteobacteria bacterium]
MPNATLSEIDAFLERNARSTLLRFSTAGSVDDGKSTLIGRLLHDSKNVYEDHLRALQAVPTEGADSNELPLALLTDGLKAEREQGITIDVAYRYFSTPKRHFILADTPGHEQYTRNMATGCSTANLTILLIDAEHGVITQTKRHAFIASLLGVPRLLITVNKMDLVDYSQSVFNRIKEDFLGFAGKLGIRELRFIPVSALRGENVVTSSGLMPWYKGETVMEYLENVYVAGDTNMVDFRFPVQYVIRPNPNYRGYAGQIAAGAIRVGEEVMVLPSLRKSRIKSIDTRRAGSERSQVEEAFAPMSVAITLEDEIDVGRGDMLVRTHNVPRIQSQFEAMLVWMSDVPMDPDKPYLIRHTSRESKIFIDAINYKVDVNTLHRTTGTPLQLNEIGRVGLTAAKPLMLDSYRKNRATGNFILIDTATFHTVGAGMILDSLPQELLPLGQGATELMEQGRVSTNIHPEEGAITKEARESQAGFRAVTLWFTGLSGSGKSTIAKGLERKIFTEGRPIYRLDGDNLRFGLNRDLGFSRKDRSENIRRAAETARLFNQAGISVICSFISPFKADRDRAREIIGADSFIEVHIDSPIEVCESRDPHGLYSKARAGEISEFTGISSPYEAPLNPEVSVRTDQHSVEESVNIIYVYLQKSTSL